MNAVRQFLVTLTEPRKGRKAPVVRKYLVCAGKQAEVLPIFDQEIGAHQREGCEVEVLDCDVRVMCA